MSIKPGDILYTLHCGLIHEVKVTRVETHEELGVPPKVILYGKLNELDEDSIVISEPYDDSIYGLCEKFRLKRVPYNSTAVNDSAKDDGQI